MAYYKEEDDLLSDEDLKKIVRILSAKAEFDPSVKRHRLDVRVRGYNKEYEEQFFLQGSDENNNDNSGVGGVGGVGGNGDLVENFDAIYYDLTNRKWEAIKITPEGWEIDHNPPILFRRYGSEKPQPYPDRNYDPKVLDEFMDLLNLKPEYKDMQKLLLKPFAISTFWPNTTAKPILILPAAQGSAKTTAFELLRDLVDSNAALTMSIPKEIHNLKQSLAHNYISFFDNVSDINDEQSDTLCRGVTGSGDMKRKLFENDEDIIYRYRRIEGLNGITNAATRADLLDRGFIVEFGEISKKDRKLLRVIWRKYLELKPKLLAYCLDVIAEVMKERQKWKGIDDDYFGMEDLIANTGGLPRMADWAILAEQIAAIVARKEGKPYEPGALLRTFNENQEILNTEALKSSLLAEALIAFMTQIEILDKNDAWEGSATMLLADLNTFINVNSESVKIDIRSRAWPQDPTALGRELARIKTNLRPLGITIESNRNKKNVVHTIRKAPTPPTLEQNPRSNEGQKGVGGYVGTHTPAPTPEEGENHAQKGDGVGSVRSIGKIEDHEEVVNTIIQRAMSYESPSDDHFTWDDFIYAAVMTPNLRWTEDQAEQTLNALIEEGKLIEEFEPGKYRLKPIGGGA